MLKVRLSAHKPRKTRAEDGDQIGDVTRLQRLGAARVRALLQLLALARRELRRLLQLGRVVAVVHFALPGRAVRARTARCQRRTAVLMKAAVLHRGHDVRVQVQHGGLAAVHAARRREVAARRHGARLHAAAAVKHGVRLLTRRILVLFHLGMENERRGARTRRWMWRARADRRERSAEVGCRVRHAAAARLLLAVLSHVERVQLLDLVAHGHDLLVLLHPVDLRVLFVHVDLARVPQHVRHQEVLVQLDASALRPRVVNLPQGDRDQALRVHRALPRVDHFTLIPLFHTSVKEALGLSLSRKRGIWFGGAGSGLLGSETLNLLTSERQRSLA